MSERVIPSDAVVCIDRFSGALMRKYQARMIPGQPVFLDREAAMEATRAYYDKVEIIDSGLTTYCAEHAKQGVTVTKIPSQRERVSQKYVRAARLMRKFPDTWVCLSKAKNKNAAQSYVWQLKHDSSPALPASEYGFRIHEVNDEWWVQATYLGKDD